MRTEAKQLKPIAALIAGWLLIGCAIDELQEASGVPDTSKAVVLGHPDVATVEKLHGTLGTDKTKVIAVLGHPSEVSVVNGKERWDYPWLAAAYVAFENGVVVDTFYTAGY